MSFRDRAYTAYKKLLHYPPGDDVMVDFAMSVVISNYRPGAHEPPWGSIVGPPSCGKSETLAPLRPWSRCFPLSNLTPKTLVSGFRDKDEGGKDHSLLKALNGKILLVEDLSGFQSLPAKDRRVVFSQLREAYSGHYDAGYGNTGVVRYGKKDPIRFVLLAGATPSLDVDLAKEQQLGQRMLILRVGRHLSPHQRIKKSMASLQNSGGKAGRRQALVDEILPVLDELYAHLIRHKTLEVGHPQALQERCVQIGALVASLRTLPLRDGDPTDPEHPDRMSLQLANLADCRAIFDEREVWNDDDLLFAARVGRDTLPPTVERLARHVYRNAADRSQYIVPDTLMRRAQIPDAIFHAMLNQWRYSGLLEHSKEHGWRFEPQIADMIAETCLFGAD